MASIPAPLAERLGRFRNLPLFVIETTWQAPLEAMQSLAQAHLDHQVDLERRGILFAAGPIFAEGSPRFPPAAGLVVIRAYSFEAARAIADSDPMHRAGLRTYTLRQWLVNEGSWQVSVRLSDQHAEIH